MLPEIKLIISQNDKLIETVTKTIEKQRLVKSLEEFQVEANAALTKMIKEIGDDKAGGDGIDEEDDEDEDEGEADSSSSISDHSKSKKKKI